MYSGLAVVGEVGSDDAKVYWLLFLMVLLLPLAICLCRVFPGRGCLYLGSASFVPVLIQVS